jgi:hypothetical protein
LDLDCRVAFAPRNDRKKKTVDSRSSSLIKRMMAHERSSATMSGLDILFSALQWAGLPRRIAPRNDRKTSEN